MLLQCSSLHKSRIAYPIIFLGEILPAWILKHQHLTTKRKQWESSFQEPSAANGSKIKPCN